MIKNYPEVHQTGIIEVTREVIPRPGDIVDVGVQIAHDGRIWLCINGQAFIRFKPKTGQINNDP